MVDQLAMYGSRWLNILAAICDMLFILRTVAIFVTLVVALALRSENLHLEEVQEVTLGE